MAPIGHSPAHGRGLISRPLPGLPAATPAAGSAVLVSGSMTRLLLSLLAALWSLLWLLVSLLELAANLHDPALRGWPLAALLGPSSLVPVLWLGAWFGSGAFQRIPLERPAKWFLSSLLACPLLAIAIILIVHGGRSSLFAWGGGAYGHLPWPGLAVYEFCKVALFQILWLGFAFGAKSFVDWQRQGRILLESQRALAESRLIQLREQLQPHFLFNTLNTISSLMATDVARADRLIVRLADLLRSSLDLGEKSLVPLDSELRFLDLYAGIMIERFSGRVAVDWQIEPPARSVIVPALLLQPLLENAFRHGVEAVSGPQTITVAARLTDGSARLDIAIRSSGGSLNPDGRDGVGLQNCRGRLGLHYGDAASLTLSAEQQGGVLAALSLPLRQALLR